MSKNTIVYSETARNIPELISAAKPMASKIAAVVVGTKEQAEAIAARGVDEVVLIPSVQDAPAEAYAATVADVSKSKNAEMVLVSLTAGGRASAAMIAQLLDAPCASEVRTMEEDDGEVVISRTLYGGKATSFEETNAPVVVVTVPLRVYPVAEETGVVAPIEVIESSAADYPVKITGVEPIADEGVDFTLANALVCIGRGVQKRDDIAMLQELADAIGGVVAPTRPLAEDYHWYASGQYVGMSGKSVKPKLLICAGVSGQIQCLAGASDSKVIVGINKDEGAPLAAFSDYFAPADLYEVVPALTAAIKGL